MYQSIITTAEVIRLMAAVAITSSIAAVVIVYRTTRAIGEILDELAGIVRRLSNGK